MKRPLLHLLFWLVYLVYDTILHYTWTGPLLKAVPEGVQLRLAVIAAITLMPVKIALVYYLIRIAIRKVLNDQRILWPVLLEIALVFVISCVLFRMTFYFVIYPKIYSIQNPAPLINARSVGIAILEMGFAGGVAFALKLYHLQIAAKEKEKNLTREKLETELKFLRNQTNPHFLFNTLNNIYALARKKSDETPGVVMKLSELLSFMLYESGKDAITVDEEIKMMEDYIELQKIRYNDRLSVQLKKGIDNGSQKIAPMLLLPLVENAFKHGVSETRFDAIIYINIDLRDSYLNFCIENTIENGTTGKENGSIGLSNIKRQLELMYKDYKINVESGSETFKVNIAINLDSYGKV